MGSSEATSDRRSLVDVFESFFEDDIEQLPDDGVASLPKEFADDLVEAIDDFLEESREQRFPDEAVMLDALSSPIIVADDKTEPRTTRRARQAALLHREVVIPLQPLFVDYKCCENHAEASRYPESLLAWTRRNAVLLRRHVISVTGRPSPFDVLGYDNTVELAAELTGIVLQPEFDALRKRIVAPRDRGTDEERETVSAWIYSAIIDLINAGSLNGNLSFLDSSSGDVFAEIVRLASTPKASPVSAPASDIQILQSLDLPAIDEVSDEDFIAIRLQSDEFEELRGALGRVLSKTTTDLRNGANLREAFRSNLEEIHLRAEAMRREIKDKSLRRFLRSTMQGVTLGAITSTASAASSDLSMGQTHLSALTARFATSVALGTFLAALFYTPPTRSRRLLRFYDVLTDERVADTSTE